MKILILAVYLAALATLTMATPQDECRNYWGKDQPCPADGKYYGSDGREQPATCDNNYQNQSPCQCAKATTKLEDCPSGNMQMDMSHCSVFCREHACGCVTVCDNGEPK